MRTDEVRLSLGVRIEKEVLARQGTREDIALVLDEAPDFVGCVAGQLIERAKIVRGDKDCFRMTGELSIEIPALPRPTLAELKARYAWIQKIERDDSPTGAITMRLATVLKPNEDQVDSETYERRLAMRRPMLLGIQHRDWLLAHQDEVPEPAQSALKALLGKIYMNFPGIILVSAGGARYFPCAFLYGGRWGESWYWVGDVFDRSGRFAVSSK